MMFYINELIAKGRRKFMNPEKIIGSAFSAFIGAMAKDSMDDAYDQEIHDNDKVHGDHTKEDVPTHMAHAIGRVFGHIAKASINPHDQS